MFAGETYFFEQSSLMLEDKLSRQISYKLKSQGATCKYVHNKFFWYIPKSKIQTQTKITDEIFSKNTGFVGNIYDFQKDGILKLLNNNRLILSYDTGLGKTIMTIFSLSYLITFASDNRKILIVAPKQILGQWKSEINQHLPSALTKIYGENDFNEARIQIISYARLRLSIKDFSDKTYLAIVFDEANYVKSIRAKQTKAANA